MKHSPFLTGTRQAVYKFLADVLISPIAVPGHDFVDRIFSSPLSFDAQGDNASSDSVEGGRLLKICADYYVHGDREEMQKEIAIDRTRLFRGAGKVNEAPPPYEAFYLAPQKEPEHMVKVAYFYHKAGLKISASSDRPDYLGLELAFMAELCDRERRLALRKNPQNHLEVLALEKEFLEDHLLRWVPTYCQKLAELARTDFFKGFAFLLRGFLNEELDWICSERSNGSEKQMPRKSGPKREKTGKRETGKEDEQAL